MLNDLSLINLKPGQEAEIITIAGGGGVIQRLADLGLVPKTKIRVVTVASFFGPVEISVRGSRLVLGRGVAGKILVKLTK